MFHVLSSNTPNFHSHRSDERLLVEFSEFESRIPNPNPAEWLREVVKEMLTSAVLELRLRALID